MTLGGYLGDRPPTDVPGFLEYARGLQKPDLYEALKDAEPLGEPFPYHVPSNLRRRYERLDRAPDGFLPFGDALCSFNPIYGQGMTVAATEADTLAKCLATGREGLSRRFFQAAAKAIDIPWDIAVGSDLQHRKVEGVRTARTRFVNWWVRKVFHTGAEDAALARKFIAVANLSSPPTSLLGPEAVWRVARRALTGGNVARSTEGAASPRPSAPAA